MPMHMHMMMFGIVGGLLHATVLGVVAFFVLFAASKAEGFVKLLGNILGLWLIILAVLGLVFSVLLFLHHGANDKDHMHGMWMMHWGQGEQQNAPAMSSQPATPPAPTTAAPATPAPAAPQKH